MGMVRFGKGGTETEENRSRKESGESRERIRSRIRTRE